tara:strand:+ start:96813 stop:97160 length:348 start_codon:yes stop_codon:yes gene_type:complete
LNTDNEREIVRSLEAIEQFTTAISDKEFGSRDARHDLANALQLCELFHLEARNSSRADEVLEKVANLRSHLRALAGDGEPNSFTRQQHCVWAREAVWALRAPLTRSAPNSEASGA